MKADKTLYAYRRHLRKCQFFGEGGRDVRLDKCNCPFHVDGKHNGERVRGSLKTRNRQVADRKVGEIVNKKDDEYIAKMHAVPSRPPASAVPTVAEAVKSFLGSLGSIDPCGNYTGDIRRSSWRKYRNTGNQLANFCAARNLGSLAEIELHHLEKFRASRAIGPRTWKVELQSLRTFFRYCVRHKWIPTNCATEIRPPKNVPPNDVVPYTLEEEIRILAACDQFGGGRCKHAELAYERLRAKAMILTLRHTALRVSDVTKLRRDAISWDAKKRTWRVFLRTTKTHEPVYLPIPPDLKRALDALPLPRNGALDCAYYFWNGTSSDRAAIGTTERTLATVFRRSGVPKAHAHRFRHTLATRLLGAGATYEEVADILGNTPEVVRKHYGKWSQGRQDNIDKLMLGHFHSLPDTSQVTNQSHEKTRPVN